MPNNGNRPNNTRKNTTTLGRPPLHPGKPRGNLTPRNRKGRPKNTQNYPKVHIRKGILREKVIRFPSAAFLAKKKIYSQNEKVAQQFGNKTYEDIMAMEEPEFNAWAASMPKNELLRLARYF